MKNGLRYYTQGTSTTSRGLAALYTVKHDILDEVERNNFILFSFSLMCQVLPPFSDLFQISSNCNTSFYCFDISFIFIFQKYSL